jgi:hypothetical protein
MTRNKGAVLLAALAISVAVLGLVLAARCECGARERAHPLTVGAGAD